MYEACLSCALTLRRLANGYRREGNVTEYYRLINNAFWYVHRARMNIATKPQKEI